METTENQIPRIWSLLEQTPWAILPEKLEAMIEVLKARATGAEISYMAARPEPIQSNNSLVAVLPLFGILAHRASLVANYSGGTSLEQFSKQFKSLLVNPDVSTIVLDVNSPGGEVYGVPELAAEIRKARKEKRIVAFSNPIAASAAYWLASQASEFYSIPSGQVGSIGVYGVHKDVSAAEQMLGLKVTLISAGKYKAEGSEHAPLTPEAGAYMQGQVDAYYQMFLDDVAAGREVRTADIESKFGQGRMVMAAEAKQRGMIDGTVSAVEALLQRELRMTQTATMPVSMKEMFAKTSEKIQTVIFSKTESPPLTNNGRGWTPAAAKGWLREHGMRSDKIDETETSYRFRQFDPATCQGGFMTLTRNFPRGIHAVTCNITVASSDEPAALDAAHFQRKLSQYE